MPPDEFPKYVPTFWQRVGWAYDDVYVLQQKLWLAIGAKNMHKVAAYAELIERKGKELAQLILEERSPHGTS